MPNIPPPGVGAAPSAPSTSAVVPEFPKNVAMKYDGQKTRVDLFPVRSYLATCQVFTYGAELYEAGNWKAGDGFYWSRLIASAERHLLDFKLGVNQDKDSTLPVLAHAMCCISMLLEHQLTGTGKDDRGVAQILPSRLGSIGDLEDLMHLLVMDPEVMAKAKKIKAERLGKQLELQAEKK